jgi:hypothetical protein
MECPYLSVVLHLGSSPMQYDQQEVRNELKKFFGADGAFLPASHGSKSVQAYRVLVWFTPSVLAAFWACVCIDCAPAFCQIVQHQQIWKYLDFFRILLTRLALCGW